MIEKSLTSERVAQIPWVAWRVKSPSPTLLEELSSSSLETQHSFPHNPPVRLHNDSDCFPLNLGPNSVLLPSFLPLIDF